jgi:hypothetical protein
MPERGRGVKVPALGMRVFASFCKKKRLFFFEKKKPKNFHSWSGRSIGSALFRCSDKLRQIATS